MNPTLFYLLRAPLPGKKHMFKPLVNVLVSPEMRYRFVFFLMEFFFRTSITNIHCSALTLC